MTNLLEKKVNLEHLDSYGRQVRPLQGEQMKSQGAISSL